MNASDQDHLKPVEIAPQTFWVGRRDPGSVFFANPYLRIFEGTDADGRHQRFSVLIDPGSSSDFALVRAKIERVIGGLDHLSMIFINHQDPDVVSSATMLTNRFARKASIMTSRETWRLIVHQNLPRDRCILTDKYPRGFTLHTGHALVPVPSPFCHFVGATMLYDPQNRVLFSGDLFGGLTPRDAKGFVATEEDWSGVRAFHQLYMPSNAAIKRTIATIRKLDPPVQMIAPQHGRLLLGDLMHDFMDRLERLEVGMDNLDERMGDPDTLPAWHTVMERAAKQVVQLIGPSGLDVLKRDRLLQSDLRVEGTKVTILQLGKATVEHAVDLLCSQLPQDLAHIVQYEAILAAEEMDLPVPRVTIEEVDDNHIGAPLPFA